MIRFYSLFISDDNLLASPYSLKCNFFHDLSLQKGTEDTVNFLLQTPLSHEQEKLLNIICDPQALSIKAVEVKTFKHQTIVSIVVLPKQVGSARIGIAYPQSRALHQEKINNLPASMVSIDYKTITREPYKNAPAISSATVY